MEMNRARHIVGLIEQPRRALFISRIYEVPVLINKLFPEVVDWVSSTWVRRKQQEENRHIPKDISPAHYSSLFSLWRLAGVLMELTLVARLWRRKY